MESASGVGILSILVTIFAVAVLLIFAPLMLYGIFSRLGEANELLRYLAERSYEDRPQQPTTAAARPAPSSSDDPSSTPAPTFRALG